VVYLFVHVIWCVARREALCSESPSGVQVVDYIGKQEEIHPSKTLEGELQIFDKFKELLA
jgi:hypothetical protein